MAAPAVEEIHEMALPNAEIDWERLDKTKFFLVGAGLFSGISCLLYPLTVVKTRVQVQDRGSATAYKSMADAYQQIFRHEGVRGFYKVRLTRTAGS
jgi:solute carrier family 25 protein 44